MRSPWGIEGYVLRLLHFRTSTSDQHCYHTTLISPLSFSRRQAESKYENGMERHQRTIDPQMSTDVCCYLTLFFTFGCQFGCQHSKRPLSMRRVAFTSALEFRICSGEPRGTRTLNPLIKSLLVGRVSASAAIHECRIFQGFGSSPVCHHVRKCAAVYPVGCRFGCQNEASESEGIGCLGAKFWRLCNSFEVVRSLFA
jgi:hypothetical protein